jgi:hypothetical protein
MGVLGEEQGLVSPFLGQPGDVIGPDRIVGRKDRYAEFHKIILEGAPAAATAGHLASLFATVAAVK